MASRYSNQHRLYSPPQQPAPGAISPRSRQQTSISPWNSSSHSWDHDSLTLPPLLGNFDDEPLMFHSVQVERSSSNSGSQQAEPSTLQNTSASLPLPRPRGIYDLSDASDLFFNFDDSTLMPAQQSPPPLSSSVVDLTGSSPGEMAPSHKRKLPLTDRTLTQSKKQRVDKASTGSPDRKIKEVDLSMINSDRQFEDYKKKQQDELIKQQNQERADKPVKLADFQCIICLDNPTDLTVTHCGHLFCSLCLHEALHAGTQKSNCPVCRTLISTTKKPSKHGDLPTKQPKNGVYVLEMKLMTARRKEKMPASSRR